ncbi:MAG: ribosome-associated translation inhibitor RaiA [Alphaproteobacteria bacterium]|nr:ribosome-associated translation inhibitor RaiA [Alphaproteobacteria bacterium]
MPINITGKNIEVGESLKVFVNDELRTLITHYMKDIMEAHVVLSKDHHLFKTDISVHISHNFVVNCHGVDDDAYKSVRNALEKLETRIKKYKTRLRDRKRHHHALDKENMAGQYFVIKPSDEDTAEENPLIIAEMAKEISSLSVGDAVMRMDVSDKPVLMFRNAVNGELNVVYRRADGHIGWIDPTRKPA